MTASKKPIAVEDQHLRQRFGQRFCSLEIGLDELHALSFLPAELLRHVRPHLRAAQHHDLFHAHLVFAEGTGDVRHVLRMRQHEDLIVLLQALIPTGEQRAHPAPDGHDAKGKVRGLLHHLAERSPEHRGLLSQPHADELDASPGKREHVRGAGAADQPRDLRRGALLGMNDQIDTEVARLKDGLRLRKLARAHPPDGRPHPQPIGHHTGHDVHLIDERDGHQHVGLLDPGLLQHRCRRGAAMDGQHIEPFAHLFDDHLVTVDHGHVVLLLREHPRHVEADFPCADNDNSHIRSGRPRAFAEKLVVNGQNVRAKSNDREDRRPIIEKAPLSPFTMSAHPFTQPAATESETSCPGLPPSQTQWCLPFPRRLS